MSETPLGEWLHRWRYRRAMREIRRGMAFFGHDLSALTDDQIEQAVFNYQQSLRDCGVTLSEAAEAFRRVGEASRLTASDLVRLRQAHSSTGNR